MNREKIITGICLSVIFLMLFSIIPSKFYKSKHEQPSDIIETNWEKLYPFAETKIENQKSAKQYIQKYTSTIKEIESKIENAFNENVLFRTKFIELNGTISKIINQKYTKSRYQIVKVKDDHLAYIEEKQDTTYIANNLIGFSKYLSKNNIDLLYVQAPCAINKFYKEPFINGYKDYANNNADNFIATIKKANIDVLDLRDAIHNKYPNEEYLELFYKTDHHWLPTTAIWATQVLGDYLNNNYSFNIDNRMYEIEKYNVKKYKNLMFGAIGRKVTLGYAKPEDFEIYYPKFQTNFHVNVPSIGIEKNGDFYNTLIYQRELEEKDYYIRNVYWGYGYGDKAIINIDNLNITKGKKVLMIKDSFADTVYPYLSMGINQLDIVDLRHFNGSLQTYINENKPDMVIMMYNPSSLVNEENLIETHTNTFDFN